MSKGVLQRPLAEGRRSPEGAHVSERVFQRALASAKECFRGHSRERRNVPEAARVSEGVLQRARA